MQKTKKQLLGFAGLAIVGIMTAVAYAMPAPGAAAAEGDSASDDGQTTINVQVTEGNPSGFTLRPSDGSETVNPVISVETSFSQVKKIEYTLSYVDDDGKVQYIDMTPYTFTPTTDSGIHKFDIDVSTYGYREYTLSTSVLGFDNVPRETDTVKFSYSATVVDVNQGMADNHDPILGIQISQDVDHVNVIVYDKNGNPAFVDENGKPVTITLKRSDIDPTTGKLLVQLPFEKYGAKAGTYTAVVSAYDSSNKLLSMRTVQIEYKPVTPETPNTGMLSIAGLNISGADYLITGLVAFAVAAGFALFLVYRKSRR